MLYFQRLLLASEPSLRYTILSNSLVNLQGHSDSFFDTDRLVKFYNGNLKFLFKAKRGSSLELETLFNTYLLSSTYFKELHDKFEVLIELRPSSEHTSKSAKTDNRLIGERLLQS